MALVRPPLFRRYERTSGHQARPALAPPIYEYTATASNFLRKATVVRFWHEAAVRKCPLFAPLVGAKRTSTAIADLSSIYEYTEQPSAGLRKPPRPPGGAPLDPNPPHRQVNRLPDMSHRELSSNVAEMLAHGVLCNAEIGRDLARPAANGIEPQDFFFARR